MKLNLKTKTMIIFMDMLSKYQRCNLIRELRSEEQAEQIYRLEVEPLETWLHANCTIKGEASLLQELRYLYFKNIKGLSDNSIAHELGIDYEIIYRITRRIDTKVEEYFRWLGVPMCGFHHGTFHSGVNRIHSGRSPNTLYNYIGCNYICLVEGDGRNCSNSYLYRL